MSRVLRLGMLLATVLLPALAYAVERGKTEIWTLYRNTKYGFALAYPSSVLVPDPTVTTPAGHLFRSTDGRVALLVGAIANDSADTIESYRQYLLSDTYPNARLDYAPLRRDWFVLSGTRPGRNGDEVFYERVTFACGGRVIYGWQLTYPASERAYYDRVVEGIHRSYRAGRGEDGSCRE